MTKLVEAEREKIELYELWKETSEACAYIAGCVDSEGTLTFKARTPAFIMSNKSKNMMEMASVFIGKEMVPTTIKRYPDSVYWLIQAYKEVPEFLRKILPYLVIKRRHAILILEYFDETDITIRSQIIDEVHRLNKKNVPDERYKSKTPYVIKGGMED